MYQKNVIFRCNYITLFKTMAGIKITSLADSKQFIATFESQLSRHKTKAACYEALEAKRVKYFGARKYSGYDSFRVVRRLHLAKQSTLNN